MYAEALNEVCAAMRGEQVRPADVGAFADVAMHEEVASLLSSRAGGSVPEPARSRFAKELRRQTVIAAARAPELVRVLTALGASRVQALLIKGAHVGYAAYQNPALRPRQDADLFVRAADRDRALDVLRSLGYDRPPVITGEAVHGQTVFEHPDSPGSVLDVHWRLSSPLIAAGLLTFDDLWANARLLPALGPHARVPDAIDAVMVAAVHQFAHHPGEHALLWAYDVHLLAQGADDSFVTEFVSRAARRGTASVCAAALRLSGERFPTADITRLISALEQRAPDRSAALLQRRSASRRALDDLATMRSWRTRIAYGSAHLFPSAAYMRATYAPGSSAPLPLLYALRIVRGLRRRR